MAKLNFTRGLGAGLALGIIGALCVFLILNARARTAEQIALNEEARVNRATAVLLPVDGDEPLSLDCRLISDPRIGQNMRFVRATQNGESKGYILTYSTSRGYSNPLILVAGFTPDLKIHRVDIAKSNETPGLGDKVDHEHGNYLDALAGLGLDDANFEVKKFGGDFDYITGATVTSRAVILATRDALEVLNESDFESLPSCRVRR